MVHKLRPYGILTTDSWRVEVKARNLAEAYRKAKKKLQELNKDPIGGKKQDLTSAYETYGKSGVSTKGFIITPKSIELHRKHNLGISKKHPLQVLYGDVRVD